MTTPAVIGHCPMGCGQTLFLDTDGRIDCWNTGCPRPDAAHRLLADTETEHLVQFDADGFTIRHPLRERLDDELMACGLHAYCAAMDTGPELHGRYRALRHPPDYWEFQFLGEASTTPE